MLSAGVNNTPYVPNMGSTQEVTIDSSGVSAEAAEGGVRVNVIPKEGGNTFRGLVFASFANESMQSSNFTDDLKARVAATPGSVAISAATGEGVPELLDAIGDRLRALAHVREFLVPYERGDVLAALHRAGEVLVEVHGSDGTRVRARLPDATVGRFAEFANAPH